MVMVIWIHHLYYWQLSINICKKFQNFQLLICMRHVRSHRNRHTAHIHRYSHLHKQKHINTQWHRLTNTDRETFGLTHIKSQTHTGTLMTDTKLYRGTYINRFRLHRHKQTKTHMYIVTTDIHRNGHKSQGQTHTDRKVFVFTCPTDRSTPKFYSSI